MKNNRPPSNRHPADELALVRAMMADLRAREKDLRVRLIAANGQHGLDGAEYRAVLRHTKRQVLCKDRLPPRLRKDPSMYRVSRSTTVLIEALEDEAWDVIERF